MKSGVFKKVLVIDAYILKPDQDSGSMRMYNLLKVFKGISCEVTFAADTVTAMPAYTNKLQNEGINVLVESSIEDHLQQSGEFYDLIILSRVDIAAKYIDCVRQLAPQAVLWFDTVDLHFVREYRGAKLTGNMNQLKRSLEIKKRECDIANRADCTLVVSDVDKAVLQKECPKARINVVSNIHEVYGSATPFRKRKNILFIGSFSHPPNVDAVLYLINDVFGFIRARLPGVRIYIAGSNPPSVVKDLSCEDVIVTGYVPDVASYFNRCRLSVAPLRFGSGVKGKVHSSMSYGVPVVASSIATEGMHLANGRDVLIADDPDMFCKAVVRLYQDELLWNKLSENAIETLSKHFSFPVVKKKLLALMMTSDRSTHARLQ